MYEADGDLWLVDVEGGEPVNLTNHPALDVHPDWSPDGTRIAFVSNRSDVPGNPDGNLEVFTIAADGTDLVQVTDTVYPFEGQSGYDHWHPSWSPDGTKLAYEWHGPSGSTEIYVANADGTGEVLLTDPSDFASKHGPDWSPDGTRLVFTWGFGYLSGQDVHVIGADGTGEVSLTPDTPWSDERNPQWSPDGLRIAFETNRDPGEMGLPNDEIYLMNADGSNLVRLTDHPAFDVEPAWSPDGTEIVFSSSRAGSYDLYTVAVPPLDGFGLLRRRPPALLLAAETAAPPAEPVTAGAGDERNARWDPSDGARLEVERLGAGAGIVRSVPAGIQCGRDCDETWPAGTVVNLRAVPRPGSTFVGWGGACSGDRRCRVVLDEDATVTAEFAPVDEGT